MGAHPDSHEGSTLQYFRRKKYRSSSEAQGKLAIFDRIIPPTMERCDGFSKGQLEVKTRSAGDREEVELWEERGKGGKEEER